jgi:hypothetical protein
MSPPEYAMPAPNVSVEVSEANELVEARGDETAAKTVARERREAERVITDWEDETRRLSHVLSFADAQYLRDDD